MKYVTVRFTEDQAYSVVRLIEGWIESAEWANNHKRATEYTKVNLAFRRRILTKLAQALVTEQAKSE